MSGKKPELAATSSDARRTGLIVLIAGGLLSVAAAFGPVWVVRAGIAIALAAGIIACAFAWKQLQALHVARASDQVEALRRQAEAATMQRQQHAEVLETLNDRHDALRTQLRGMRIKHADLLVELNSLRGDKNALASDVQQAAEQIAALREQVAQLEMQLPDDVVIDEAEVLALPRRVGRATTDVVLEDDLYPTVIDLQALALPLVEEVKRDHA